MIILPFATGEETEYKQKRIFAFKEYSCANMTRQLRINPYPIVVRVSVAGRVPLPRAQRQHICAGQVRCGRSGVESINTAHSVSSWAHSVYSGSVHGHILPHLMVACFCYMCEERRVEHGGDMMRGGGGRNTEASKMQRMCDKARHRRREEARE